MLAAPRAVFFGLIGFFSFGLGEFVPRGTGQIARGFTFANRDFAIGGRPFFVRPFDQVFLRFGALAFLLEVVAFFF